MLKTSLFSAQGRIHFSPEQHLKAGVGNFFITQFSSVSEALLPIEWQKQQLAKLQQKYAALKKNRPDIVTGVMTYTLSHPEGQCQVPDCYQVQKDIDGRERPGFVCFLDHKRQQDLLEQYRTIAELGFDAVLIDDDFRDCFCFCELHLEKFSEYIGHDISLEELREKLDTEDAGDEITSLRRKWIDFKYRNLYEFGKKIEQTVHSITPGCRIGICISAKRCNDLCGREINSWINLFDTNQAPVFVRLPGECYDSDSLKISQSAAWHSYYRNLVPPNVEKITEVTYVHALQPVFKSNFKQQIEMHLAAGLPNQLLAWTEDFQVNEMWSVLESNRERFEKIKSLSFGVDGNEGIAIFCPENRAHLSAYSTIEDEEQVHAYSTLAHLGFPVKLVPRLDPNNAVTVVTSPVHDQDLDAIRQYLGQGRTIVFDGSAIDSLSKVEDGQLVKITPFDIAENIRYERFNKTGELIGETAAFPYDAVRGLKTDHDVEVITELLSHDKQTIAPGIVRYQAFAGTVVVLPHSIKKIGYRLACKQYRNLFKYFINSTDSPYKLCVEGSFFVFPLLFTTPRTRIVLVNCHPEDEIVSLEGDLVEGKTLADPLDGRQIDLREISVESLGVRILDLA